MKIILGGRNTGKSNMILKWMTTGPVDEVRVAVCHNTQAAEYLKNRAMDRGLLYKTHICTRDARCDQMHGQLEPWQFVSFREMNALRGRAYPRRRLVVALDEADLILSAVIGEQVGAISLGGEVELASPFAWEHMV